MRVYLPATTTVLQRLLDEGRLEGPHTVFTVTPQLRDFYELSDDDEELEYAALLAAARASLRLMDVDPLAARRRVVLAADVPDDANEFGISHAETGSAAGGATGGGGAAVSPTRSSSSLPNAPKSPK